ncbi:MAG TPA: hypothetical protein VNM69_06435 [Bacillus sp. (in: firmicutes)]|nr:hypothetical protein [Bacillus sp. (in: firmicutes)]
MQWKKLLLLLSVLFLLFSLPATGFAEEKKEEKKEEEKSNAIITKKDLDEMEKPTYAERFTSGLFTSVANDFIKLFGAQDVSYLVFQRESIAKDDWLKDGFLGDREGLVLGVFPEKYFNGIATFYDFFRSLLPIPAVVLLAGAGLLLLIQGFSSENRANAKTYLAGFIYFVLVMRFGTIIFEILFGINYFIVDAVWSLLKENEIPVGRFLDTIWGGKEGFEELTGFGGLGIALMVFCAVFMTFVLNYQYSLRMIMLSVMIIMFPFVMIGLIFPTKRQALSLWVHEVISHIFVQAAHAIALGLFFYMRHHINEISFWLLLSYFFGLPTIVGAVQSVTGSVLGVPTGGGNRMLNGFNSMMGITALMSAGRMVNTLRGKKDGGVLDKGGDKMEQMDRKGEASDRLQSPLDLEKGNKTKGSAIGYSNGKAKSYGVDGRITNHGSTLMGNAIRKTAQVVGGVGGAVGGAAISTMMTGNPVTGAAVGGALGGATVGKVGARIGSAVDGTTNLIQDAKDNNVEFIDAFKNRIGYEDKSQLFDPKQAAMIGENIAGTPGRVLGAALGHGNQMANKVLGDRYGAESIQTIDDLNRVKNERQEALQTYQAIQPQLATAKLQKDQAQAQYGKGSAYHNNLVTDYEQAKSSYQLEQSKLSQIDKQHNPVAYKMQQEKVDTAKQDMLTKQQAMNTPHEQLKSAVENYNSLQSQSLGFQTKVQEADQAIQSFYKKTELPTQNEAVQQQVQVESKAVVQEEISQPVQRNVEVTMNETVSQEVQQRVTVTEDIQQNVVHQQTVQTSETITHESAPQTLTKDDLKFIEQELAQFQQLNELKMNRKSRGEL